MNDDVIVKIAQVESIDDESDGLRIKARLSQDDNTPLENLPYAFPLLPKTFQSVPKVGEAVLIITAKVNNNFSNRYYIGPIISQPQHQEYDAYNYGRGSAISLLQGKAIEPLPKISNYDETNGSFPDTNDIAIVGRKGEDVILKDNEIDLRCGIRLKDETDNVLGNVIFNKYNPAYLQLKYKRSIGYSSGQEADSIINLVADKINLISHKDINSFNLTDNKELIKEKDMDAIMSKLHEVPYGDILVSILNIIREAIINHVHPYPGLIPCKDQYIKNLENNNFNDVLSQEVRIS